MQLAKPDCRRLYEVNISVSLKKKKKRKRKEMDRIYIKDIKNVIIDYKLTWIPISSSRKKIF